MLATCCAAPKFSRPRQPKVLKKLNSVRRTRDRQMKTIVDDISNIAREEIDRVSELVKEVLDDPTDNPIVIDKQGYEGENEE